MAITFDVSPVELAKAPLGTQPFRLGVERSLGLGVEACGGSPAELVHDVRGHPFLEAVRLAFADHRPLALRPDDVWLLLAQGFAHHVKLNAEALRSRLVEHDGREAIRVRRDDFAPGAQNAWGEVLDALCEGVACAIGKRRDLVVADFSTTGPAERAASQVALLDAMSPFFRYELMTFCGIPSITLLGTPDDWRSVATRARYLGEVGLEPWSAALAPILERFVDASVGRADPAFWRSLYKLESASGGARVTGWVNVFFPFLHDDEGRFVPNPYAFEWSAKRGPTTSSFPRGVSRAPFEWQYLSDVIPMELIGGFVGVSQDPATLTVRPEIGWAVRPETSDAPASSTDDSGRRVHHVFVVGPPCSALDVTFDHARDGAETRDETFDVTLAPDVVMRVIKGARTGVVPSGVILVVAGPAEDWSAVAPAIRALERDLLRAGRLRSIPMMAVWDTRLGPELLPHRQEVIQPFLQNVRMFFAPDHAGRCLQEIRRHLLG
jgi:hypothetical protein